MFEKEKKRLFLQTCFRIPRSLRLDLKHPLFAVVEVLLLCRCYQEAWKLCKRWDLVRGWQAMFLKGIMGPQPSHPHRPNSLAVS